MIDVRLPAGLPSASATWDAAQALGAALLATGRWTGVTVQVNDNRRTLVRYTTTGRRLTASVHHALLPHVAPLVRLIAHGDRDAWASLSEEVAERPPSAKPVRLRAAGEVHDLDALAVDERARLPVPVDAPVGWGHWPGQAATRVVRLGSCSAGPSPIIRLHPVLDHDEVPGWFVGFVLFHELLHVAVPPEPGNGRRRIHSPSFLRAERVHPEFHRANAWEVANIDRLIARINSRRSPDGRASPRG